MMRRATRRSSTAADSDDVPLPAQEWARSGSVLRKKGRKKTDNPKRGMGEKGSREVFFSPPPLLPDLPLELLVRIVLCLGHSPVDIARTVAVSRLFHEPVAYGLG